MRTRFGSAVAGIAVLAATGALTVGAAPTASAEEAFNSCDLSVKAAELAAMDRTGRYNIVVWKDGARRSASFNGIITEGDIRKRGCNGSEGDFTYHWVVFHDGDFTRQGDGGYRNWAFSGRFERNDTQVRFLARF
jgi:hypothetical protein